MLRLATKPPGTLLPGVVGGGVGKLCGLQLEHRGVCYWSGLQGRTGQIARGAGQVLLGPPELMWELCVH